MRSCTQNRKLLHEDCLAKFLYPCLKAEVELEKRPTKKSCDRASNNINQSHKLFIDVFDMYGF